MLIHFLNTLIKKQLDKLIDLNYLKTSLIILFQKIFENGHRIF